MDGVYGGVSILGGCFYRGSSSVKHCRVSVVLYNRVSQTYLVSRIHIDTGLALDSMFLARIVS